MPLTQALTRIDSHVEGVLAPPAKEAAITKLSQAVFGGEKVPDDIVALFRWHDGQTKIQSLHPENNRTLMSIAEAIEAWQFLSDPKEEILQPWSKSWLPLFSNGAGDFVCIETSGKKRGALIGYWHADADRVVEFESLAAWANDLATALDAAEKKPKPGKMRLAFVTDAAVWKPRKRPAKREIANAAIGTVLWFRKSFAMSLEHELVCLYVKVEASKKPWRHATAVRAPGCAFAHIEDIAGRKKQPDDYEWKCDDDDVTFALEEAKTTMTGTVEVTERVPVSRDVDVSSISLRAGKWTRAKLAEIHAADDDLGTAYRVVTQTKREPQARIYVKIAADVWVGFSAGVDGDSMAEISTRLREKTKYPRYQLLRDMEIRDLVEFALDGKDDLMTASVARR